MGNDPVVDAPNNRHPELFFEEVADATELVFTFRRNKLAADVNLVAKVSEDLVGWDQPSVRWKMTTEDVGEGDHELITMRQTLTPADERAFLRLEVETAP
jgi:hypothetical protein